MKYAPSSSLVVKSALVSGELVDYVIIVVFIIIIVVVIVRLASEVWSAVTKIY
jgi:hypothetical protein